MIRSGESTIKSTLLYLEVLSQLLEPVRANPLKSWQILLPIVGLLCLLCVRSDR